jgi:hypothetical protein
VFDGFAHSPNHAQAFQSLRVGRPPVKMGLLIEILAVARL